MASIFPDYEYDIFISYRQNDNKYDGWVTEFVANLNKELEAIIKDRLSVYFDANPHDGLLETHSVGQSLENKLRCLIFIPILSRTFCDSNSFAWNNEFLAFLKLAGEDRLGLNIRLGSGNVASRVLPVRIHDLDPEDIKLAESHLGVIRSVDFIYKSAGVNRPLRAIEDHPHDNLNKTYYRDQINKVANAIDEIIHGLKRMQASSVRESQGQSVLLIDGQTQSGQKSTGSLKASTEGDNTEKFTEKKGRVKVKRSIYSFTSLGVVLAVVALFLFSSGSTLPFSKRDWIVITDFENLTQNPVFDKSLYTAFSLSASQSSYVNVFPRSRMVETLARMEIRDRTTIDEKTGREIAVREGINIVIVPSISEIGNRFVISAKVLETKTGNLLRSETLYADRENEILLKLDQLSKKIRRDLGESRYEISTQDKPLSKVTTSSLEALKLYSLGIERHSISDFTAAKDYYENALRIDTGFVAAKASLGNILIEKFDSVQKGRVLLNQAINSVSRLTEREKLGILAFNAVSVEKDIPKGIRYAKMRTDLYPDDPAAHNNLGWYYQISGRFDEALEEYKAAVRINRNMALTYGGILWIYLEKVGKPDSALIWAEKMISDNPQNVWGYCNLGSAWICLDSLNEAEAAFVKAREINPDFILNLYRLAHTYRLKGDYNKAIAILRKIVEKNKTEASAYYDLGINYLFMGNRQEAGKNFNLFRDIASKDWLKKWPDDAGTYISISAVEARLGNMEASDQMFRKAIQIDSSLHIRYAEVLCIQGKANEAIDELGNAFRNGYRNLFWLKLSPDLHSLKNEQKYKTLMNRYFQ